MMKLSNRLILQYALEDARERRGFIVSLPNDPLAMDLALSLFKEAEERIPTEVNPMRASYVCNGTPVAMVFADPNRIIDEPTYLEKFVEMATEFCDVADIMVLYGGLY